MIKAVYGEVFDDGRKDWIKRIQSFAEAEKTLPRTIHPKTLSSGLVESLHQAIHPKCQSLSFVVSLLPQDQIGSYLHQRSLQSSYPYRQGCPNHYYLQRSLPQRNQPYQGMKALVTCLEYPQQSPLTNQEQQQIDLHQPTASSEWGSTYPEVKNHDDHDSLTPNPN